MSPRPKVLVFRSDYLPVSETFISDHLRSLRRYKPLVVCQRDLPANHRTDHPVLQVGHGRLARPLFENLGWAPALSRLIQREQPALVHAHFLTDAAKLLPFMARNRLPFIVTAHGFDATTYDEHLATFPDGARLLQRRAALIQRVDKILCVSQFIKDELVARGYPAEKLEVAHLGIDLSQYPEPTPLAQRSCIVTTGRLVEKKGTRFLIDAYAQLPAELRASHPLRIVGDGPLRPVLEAQARSLGINVDFLGAQPRSAVFQALAQAAVFAFPSVRAANGDAEGMGIALMEAMALGVPLAVLEDQPMTPLLAEGGAAEIAGTSGHALAGALTVLLTQSERAQRIVDAAQIVLTNHFDLSVQTAELEQVYTHVVTGAPQQATSASPEGSRA